MTGAASLLLGAGLVALAAGRGALALRLRSRTSTIVAAYCLAWAEVVLVLLALSPPRWVTPVGVLVATSLVAAVTVAGTRGRAPALRPALGGVARDLVTACRDGVVATVAVPVAAGVAYAVVLTVTTPQNDFDAIYDHLWRAVLWFTDRAIGYPDCSCAPYINAYPPVGEMGTTLTMVLGRSDRYVGLPQSLALLAVVTGVVGIGRRVGASRREAVLGGLLVATLPVIALQASTAQNDLVVASFLVVATLLLLDRDPASPWLAAIAVALAVGTKVSAPFGLPLLLAVALLGRPAAGRAARAAAVVAGAAVGGTWYLVNRHETGALTGGFPDIPVEHTVVAALGRISREAIELVDLSGARGSDLALYALVGLVFALGVGLGIARRRGLRTALAAGALTLAVAASPLLLPRVGWFLERSHVNVFDALGRPDLNVDIGRDIRRSASNFSWYGPLGSLLLLGALVAVTVAVRRRTLDRVSLVLAAAPVYWVIAYGAAVYYLEFAGRYFMYPVALAAATWGIVLRSRPVAWGVASIAVVTLALVLVNDAKRPLGVRLLEGTPPPSYFAMPRWEAQGVEARAGELTRYVDGTVPADASVALSITAHDPGYLFYGRGLDRRIRLVAHDVRDVPDAGWLFASPGAGPPPLCAAWRRLPDRPQQWWVYRRAAGATCA